MADTPIEERRFTDREVREILKTAVEKGPSNSLTSGHGLSLSELKAIGTEVGIDPVRLEEAARAVAQKDGSGFHGLIGAPTVLHFYRRVEGEYDPTCTPEVMSIIRHTIGLHGEVSEVGGSLEWRAKGAAGERFVTVSAKDGTVTIEGSANLTDAARNTYLPAGLMAILLATMGVLVSVEEPSIEGLVLSMALLPTVYIVLRAILRKISGSESMKLQQVVDEVARLTQGSEGQGAGTDRAT